MRRGLCDGRCGCHKGPRDHPEAYLYSRDNKSSTAHERAVLFERISVWFVALITRKACVPLLVSNLDNLHSNARSAHRRLLT